MKVLLVLAISLLSLKKKVGVKKRASEERVLESDKMANGAFAARLSHARREKEIQYTNQLLHPKTMVAVRVLGEGGTVERHSRAELVGGEGEEIRPIEQKKVAKCM